MGLSNGRPAQHVSCRWEGFEAIHRYEDLAVIADVIRTVAPVEAVELGTAEGGFAAFLADTMADHEGRVLTVDHVALAPRETILARRSNLQFLTADVLTDVHPQIRLWLEGPNRMLYCDNGNKPRELALYAPLLGPGGLVGTHDYDTEVDPAWAEPFMASLGYQPYRHEDFARLADPECYWDSLTRFWRRS